MNLQNEQSFTLRSQCPCVRFLFIQGWLLLKSENAGTWSRLLRLVSNFRSLGQYCYFLFLMDLPSLNFRLEFVFQFGNFDMTLNLVKVTVLIMNLTECMCFCHLSNLSSHYTPYWSHIEYTYRIRNSTC